MEQPGIAVSVFRGTVSHDTVHLAESVLSLCDGQRFFREPQCRRVKEQRVVLMGQANHFFRVTDRAGEWFVDKRWNSG